MPPRPPDLLDRGWQALGRALDAPSSGPVRADLAGAAFLLVLAALLLAAPVLYVQDLPLDLFVQLDGAWRWMAGQRPHVDFYTPVGDLWYVLLGLAGTLSGGDPLLVVYSSVLLAPLVAVGAWVATDRRLPPLPRVMLAVAITCCALSPRTLDSSLVSGVATYNRYGWAFVAIIAVAALLEPFGARRIGPTVAVVAVALVATFWMKVTYLGLAGAALVLSLVCAPANRRMVLASSALGGVGVVVSAVSSRGQGYLADLARAAEAASGGPGLLRLERVASEVRTNLTELLVIGALGMVVMRTSRDTDEERVGTRVVGAAVGFTVVAMVITSQSHDRWIPVLVIPVAMCFAALRARPLANRLPSQLAGTALVGLLGFGVAMDTAAIAVLAIRPQLGPTNALGPCPPGLDCPGERIRIPPGTDGMIDLVTTGQISGPIYDNLKAVPWNVDNGPILRDAMALVHEHGLTQEKIASLTFSPSFPWLFGAPPPRHLPAWWDWQRTFGAADEARMAAMLADSDVVLVPKMWRVKGVELADPALAAAFEIRGQTPLWTLWVRRSP